MAEQTKFKAQRLLQKDTLADWLRSVADGEPVFDGQPLPLEGCKSFKLSIKDVGGDMLRAKVSVKFPKPGEDASTDLADQDGDEAGEEDGEEFPKYKSLKKHMKQTFKAIGAALAQGQLPPEMETLSFVADARLMATYPGKGDPDYPAFLEGLETFENALINQDIPSISQAYQSLAQLKKDCHQRYA